MLEPNPKILLAGDNTLYYAWCKLCMVQAKQPLHLAPGAEVGPPVQKARAHHTERGQGGYTAHCTLLQIH